MFLCFPLEIRTPGGWYRVRLARRIEAEKQRCASLEEIERIRFFLSARLEYAAPGELLPLVELYRELTGERLDVWETGFRSRMLGALLRELEWGLRSGRLNVEVLKPPMPAGELEEPEPRQVEDQPPRRYIPPQTPSEIWGRNSDDEEEMDDALFRSNTEPADRVAEPQKAPVHFELSFVDEFGDPIPGASPTVEFKHDGAKELIPADGGGTARLDKPNGSTSASARLADNGAVEALGAAVRPLWDQSPRIDGASSQLIAKEDADTSIMYYRSASPPKPGQPSADSPLLKRELQLVSDKPHRVSIQPYVELVRICGAYFDTNKCFLLPTVVPSLAAITDAYERNPGASVLIVGHTDTSGQDAYNEELSLERANAMAAYLRDDVDTWMAWYGWDKPESKRWGEYEDLLMIESLTLRGLVVGDNRVLSYQIWHNALSGSDRADNWQAIKEDGKMGPETRAQLVGDYMHHDRTSLDKAADVTVHGCGEVFPLEDTSQNIDPNPANPDKDLTDRRVEIFLFDAALGIQPPAPAATSKRGSTEYPEWRARSKLMYQTTVGGSGTYTIRYRLHDEYSRPMTDVPYRASPPGQPVQEGSSPDGWITIDVPAYLCFEAITIEWGEPDASGAYPFSAAMVAECDIGTEEQQARAKLNNLGIPISIPYLDAVHEFQWRYRIPEAGLSDQGELPPLTRMKLWSLYNSACDATRPEGPSTL